MRISDWSSDVCSSDLRAPPPPCPAATRWRHCCSGLYGRRSALDGARRQARDDASLQPKDEPDERQRRGHRGGHHLPPRRLVSAGSADERDRPWHGALLRRERDGAPNKKPVPGEEEGKQTGQTGGG